MHRYSDLFPVASSPPCLGGWGGRVALRLPRTLSHNPGVEPGGDFHAASVLSSPVSCQPVMQAGCQQGPLALPAPVTSLPIISEDTLVPCSLLSLSLPGWAAPGNCGGLQRGRESIWGGRSETGAALISQGQLYSGSPVLMRVFMKEVGQQALVHSASKVTSKMADFLRSPSNIYD